MPAEGPSGVSRTRDATRQQREPARTSRVYLFGGGTADGDRTMRRLLGGKGANLAEMARIGIPVPPGFTITTEACREYLASGSLPDGLTEEIDGVVARLEEMMGRRFGGPGDPLLLSIRSGAAFSMPGMMDTVLNLGLNDETVAELARAAGDERFARDCHRRFLQMYADVVLGVEREHFEETLRALREREGASADSDLSAEVLAEAARRFREIAAERASAGEPASDGERASGSEPASGSGRASGSIPDDPREQLLSGVEAVFGSWNTRRARNYRKAHRIPDDLGTAANVQVMVYGNRGPDSGSGVAFTRDPATGERGLYGEFLPQAQGEDVVSGARDPLPLTSLDDHFPGMYEELVGHAERLERHYREMQDLEFTVEEGTLWLLQTRTGKRTPAAALRIAVEMEEEGLIDRAETLRRMDPEVLERLLHPTVDPAAEITVLAEGLPASPGAASGRAAFTADDAVERHEAGEPVILVRPETSPDDFHGMLASRAIVTARGGMTSHAAVVARGMGKSCVVGARALEIDVDGRRLRADGRELGEGDWLTVDGTEGRVLAGDVATVQAEPGQDFRTLMAWADEARRLGVRANADTPEDAERARAFGAEGIGLCRTEHMFFGEGRVRAVREMILAEDSAARRAALERLLPMQREDFLGIFRAMDGLPVTVRLLDPPLHEFLPAEGEEMEALAERLGIEVRRVLAAVRRLREVNPMLGHRGCRLGYTYPEITEMQARALFEAALAARREGVDVRPEVMVPLVGHPEELRRQRAVVDRTAAGVFEADRASDANRASDADRRPDAHGEPLPYLVGTMIELPRACLVAGEIARETDFFSFGTNDLTQTTLGISRDDAAGFLPLYVEDGLYPVDPFQALDLAGVGELIRIACERGRAANPDLKLGICGEHGAEPRAVAFFDELGLDYVSCSPFRLPVARLAAARAALGVRSGIEAGDDV